MRNLGGLSSMPAGLNLALEQREPEHAETARLVGRFVGESLRVDKIYADLCASRVEFRAPPVIQCWGGTLAHLHDPDGNVLMTLLAGEF